MAESVEEQNTQEPTTCCGYKIPGKEEYEPCGIDFKKYGIKPLLQFSSSESGKKFCFFHHPDNKPHHFDKRLADFFDAVFETGEKDLDIKGVIFKEDFNFGLMIKNHPPRSLNDFVANLSYAVFDGDVIFNGELIPKITAKHTIFKKNFTCRNLRYLDISESVFEENSEFESYTVPGGNFLKFNGVKFKSKKNAIYGHQPSTLIDFSGADFEQYVQFTNMALHEGRFEKTIFQKGISFTLDRNQHPSGASITFKGATFGKKYDRETQISFENSKFTGETIFSNATFYTCPKFFNSSFYEHTDFTNANFEDVDSDHAESAYSALKYKMEARKNRSDEIQFHALELESRRRKKTPINAEWYVLSAYKIFSDYGKSVGMPIKWLIGILIFFTCVYYWFFTYGAAPCNCIETLKYSFIQTFKPFSIFSIKEQVGLAKLLGIEKISIGLMLLSALQATLNLTIFTLLIFAIRRRFKME